MEAKLRLHQEPVEPAKIRTDINGKQLHCFEIIIFLERMLRYQEKTLMPRLKLVKWGLRDYRLAGAVLNRLITNMVDTMPVNKVLHAENQVNHCEIDIHPVSASIPKTKEIVNAEDISLICSAAIQGHCSMCMAEGNDIKKCTLRNALQRVVTPNHSPRYSSMCEFYSAGAGLYEEDEKHDADT